MERLPNLGNLKASCKVDGDACSSAGLPVPSFLRLSSASDRWVDSADLTARSASFSCATGWPNRASYREQSDLYAKSANQTTAINAGGDLHDLCACFYAAPRVAGWEGGEALPALPRLHRKALPCEQRLIGNCSLGEPTLNHRARPPRSGANRWSDLRGPAMVT